MTYLTLEALSIRGGTEFGPCHALPLSCSSRSRHDEAGSSLMAFWNGTETECSEAPFLLDEATGRYSWPQPKVEEVMT